MKSIKSHINQLLKSLNEGVFEKEHTLALSLLSAMAGESIFLLGPPGVAKSWVARRLKLAFRKTLAESIERAKAKETKMYAISLGGKSAENSYLNLCDKYWEYNIHTDKNLNKD